MMPVVPATKRSTGFSIDSLMSKDPRKSPAPAASTSRRSRTPESGSCSPGRDRESPRGGSPAGRERDRESRHSLGSVGSLGSPGRPQGDSPRAAAVMGGAGSSFHPVAPGASLLNGLKGLYGAGHEGPIPGHPSPGGLPHGFPEGLAGALGLHHGAVHPAHPMASPALHPPHGLPGMPMVPPAHAGLPPHPLLLGAQRDPFSMYPWLLSRQGGYFNHPRLLGEYTF